MAQGARVHGCWTRDRRRSGAAHPASWIGVIVGSALFSISCMPDFDALSYGTNHGAGGSSSSSSTHTNTGCTHDSECPGQACFSGVCVDTCADQRKDGNETDIDCGGDKCGRCEDGSNCKIGSDCKSNVCGPNNLCIEPSCSDQVKDQDETGIDCGGVCAHAAPYQRCPTSGGCSVASDCESFLCNATAHTCDPPDSVSSLDMIADMEDPTNTTNKILQIGGRVGSWFSFRDGTPGGTLADARELIPGGRGPTSQYAMHTTGSGFTSWGAGIGFDLNNPGASGNTKQIYNASAYRGMKFWLRGDTEVQMRVQFVDVDTYDYPMAPATTTVCTKCDDHFGKSVKITKEWVLYQLLFAELSQQGYGDPVAHGFVPSQMIAVQFQMSQNVTFDFWVDDVAFFR